MIDFTTLMSRIEEAAPAERKGLANIKGMPRKAARKLAYAMKGPYRHDEYMKALARWSRKTTSKAERDKAKIDKDIDDFRSRMGIGKS